MGLRIASYNDQNHFTAEQYCAAFGHQPKRFADGVACRNCFAPMEETPREDGQSVHYVIRDDAIVEVSKQEAVAIQKKRKASVTERTKPFDMDKFIDSMAKPQKVAVRQ